MKDPVEVRLPSRDRILVVPRVKESGDSVPPALFDEPPLYFRDSPAMKRMLSRRARDVYDKFNSRRQLIYRITHGFAEVHLLSVHSPVEGSTDIDTEQPELNIVSFIDHCVLAMCEPRAFRRRKGGSVCTRIMVRRIATEPKTALAGVMLEISLARFRPSMAMFSEERTPSCPFGCWDLSAMVETQYGCGKVRRCAGCAGTSEHERPSRHLTLDPLAKRNSRP